MTEPQRKRVCRSDGEGGLNLWSGTRYRASKPALISAEFRLFFFTLTFGRLGSPRERAGASDSPGKSKLFEVASPGPRGRFPSKISELNPKSPQWRVPRVSGLNHCEVRSRYRAPSAAQILERIIRQNFFLRRPTGGRGGIGGLNLCRVWAGYRIGFHAHIFFLSAEVLIQSKKIKLIKHAVNAGVSPVRDDDERENWAFIFRWLRGSFLSVWKSAAKFRVGGGGSWTDSELMRWVE
jgi:hypothetical protein